MKIYSFFIITLLIVSLQLFSQQQSDIFDYTYPEEYVVGAVVVSGLQFLDPIILAGMSGLTVGKSIKVPGDDITQAIRKYWKQGLFSDVRIFADSIVDGKIYINIFLQERPRISDFTIEGVKKSESKDLIEKLELKKGSQLTENVLNNIKVVLTKHYVDKGFYNVRISFEQIPEPGSFNKVVLKIFIDRNERMKIESIEIEGNTAFTDKRLERTMKKTKEKSLRNFFRSSKYIEGEFKEDKIKLIDFYNKHGYRDAKILADSIRIISDRRMKVFLTVYEGEKYYFRNITWLGNTKFSSEQLSKALGIKKGDVYNQDLLNKRMFMAEDAVTSLYLDNGYLFSNIDPVEINIVNDSIDLEMRVFEGRQARLNDVVIAGNTKTNEHVIRRELRTKPGDLFSKRDIIRSVRELAQLGHFDPEQIDPNPIPDQANGTVNMHFNLVEKANDQLELSGGWGANMLVGTLGVRFNNFSARNIFNGSAWRPVPSGDGQSLSLRAQTNGRYYKAYSLSFIEPWFGGKKPNSFSFSMYHSVYNNSNIFIKSSDRWMKISGVSIGLGRRLKWPDDYFTLYNELSFQNYSLRDWQGYFIFIDGTSKNASFTTTLGRNSTDQPIFPRLGSQFSMSVQATPPYSLINGKDYSIMNDREKYRWIEYHKWKFKSAWFTSLVGNLVLHTKAEFGYLAYYNKTIGPSPFEGFDVGGDGLSGYNIYGRETIALRGYENSSLTPMVKNSRSGNLFEKITVELRYPFVLKPAATVFGMLFTEAGNCWYEFAGFNPYDIKRSAGVGIRAFLPMFGLLGVDWGYGFDAIPGNPSANKGHFHFVIGQQF